MYLVKTMDGIRASMNIFYTGQLVADQIQAFDLIKDARPYNPIEINGYTFTLKDDKAVLEKVKTYEEKMAEAMQAMSDAIKKVQVNRHKLKFTAIDFSDRDELWSVDLWRNYFTASRPLGFININNPEKPNWVNDLHEFNKVQDAKELGKKLHEAILGSKPDALSDKERMLSVDLADGKVIVNEEGSDKIYTSRNYSIRNIKKDGFDLEVNGLQHTETNIKVKIAPSVTKENLHAQELRDHALQFLDFYIDVDCSGNPKGAYKAFTGVKSKDKVKESHLAFYKFWKNACIIGLGPDEIYNEWRKSLK